MKVQDLSEKKRGIKNPYWQILVIGMVALTAIYFLAFLTINYLVPVVQHVQNPVEGSTAYLFITTFFLFFTPLIYLFNCLICRQWIRPDWSSLLLHLGVLFFLGTSFEVIVDSIFVWTTGSPSWLYHILPVHNGYTSAATFVIWPMYGMHLYFFHEALKLKGSRLTSNIVLRGIMVAIDAMVLETLANMFALIGFSSYYFYYLPSDLFHFTTLQIVIPYIISGIVGISILEYLDKSKKFKKWIALLAYVFGLIVVFVLS